MNHKDIVEALSCNAENNVYYFRDYFEANKVKNKINKILYYFKNKMFVNKEFQKYLDEDLQISFGQILNQYLEFDENENYVIWNLGTNIANFLKLLFHNENIDVYGNTIAEISQGCISEEEKKIFSFIVEGINSYFNIDIENDFDEEICSDYMQIFDNVVIAIKNYNFSEKSIKKINAIMKRHNETYRYSLPAYMNMEIFNDEDNTFITLNNTIIADSEEIFYIFFEILEELRRNENVQQKNNN